MSRKVAYSAIMIALAMIFSYVEALIPVDFGIPGVKLGIPNIVIVVGLYTISFYDVLIISILRVILTGILFGNVMTIWYSLAGGLLSIAIMWLLKRTRQFSMIGVSVAGGVSHNMGQLFTAIFFVKNLAVGMYFPVLMIAGVITGAIIGFMSRIVLDRISAIRG